MRRGRAGARQIMRPIRKVGRNDPCPCGSGRKYKKCHLVLEEMRSAFASAPAASSATPVHGRSKIDALWQGQRVRAVGNRLYFRKPTETFHEFLMNVLRLTLGKEWYMGEVAKAPDDRHEIVQWFYAFGDFTKGTRTEEHRRGEQLWVADPTGSVQALVTLAYDVYHLQHTDRLPDALLNRLKNRQEFQGAKYEIAVAATLARMMWRIEWIEDKSAKHCEFIAHDPSGTLSVGVEAKSRHRAGVLHQPGDVDLQKAARGDVDRLFREALSQAPPDIPFIVFVDLNVPPSGGQMLLETPLLNDLRRMVEAYGTPTPSSPDPYTALVLTSFPWHYVGDLAKAPRGQHLMVIPKYAWHPLPLEALEHLRRALNEYGRVPPEDEER